MLTYRLEVVNLSHNKITKDGLFHIADKFKAIQEEKNRITTLSLKSNEMNDFCLEYIKEII